MAEQAEPRVRRGVPRGSGGTGMCPHFLLCCISLGFIPKWWGLFLAFSDGLEVK